MVTYVTVEGGSKPLLSNRHTKFTWKPGLCLTWPDLTLKKKNR